MSQLHDRGSTQPLPDRGAALAELCERCAAGALTLGELAKKAAQAGAVTTSDELKSVLVPATAPAPPSTSPGRWAVAILGGVTERGRWRAPRRLRLIAFLGGAELDYRAATLEGPETQLTVIAFLGGAKVIVPAAIPVQLSGIGLLGGRTDEREVGLTIPGAPLLRVRAFAVLGGVEISDRSDEERRRVIHLDKDELVIELRGMGAVAAFRRQLRVPYTAIRSVGDGPADIPPWWEARMGTAVPFTDIRHGRFRHRGTWSFCAVHDADHAVTLELEDVALRGRPLRRAIVGVEDPIQWRQRIEDRLAQTGSS